MDNLIMQTLNRYEIVDKVARAKIAELEANGVPTVEAEGKIPFPVDSEGNLDYGTAGYAIVSNGDGTVRYEASVGGGGENYISSFANPLLEYAKTSMTNKGYSADGFVHLMIIFDKKEDETYGSAIVISPEITGAQIDNGKLVVNNSAFAWFSYSAYVPPSELYDFAFIQSDLINSRYCDQNMAYSKAGKDWTKQLYGDVKIYTNFMTDMFDGLEGIEWLYFDDAFSLQSKIVNENGEVLPDEGYYGLSKVTVDVKLTDTWDTVLYKHFNIDRTTYPYVVVWVSNDPAYGYSQVVFSDNSDGFYFNNGDTYFVGWHWITMNSTAIIPHSDAHTELSSIISTLSREDLVRSSGYSNGNGATYKYKIQVNPSTVFKTYGNFDFTGIDERLDKIGAGGDMLFQEKTVNENGEVLPDEGYRALRKVTVNVPVSNSVPDGYMVNFFNTERELIQTHSAKYGYSVDKPISYDNVWCDLDGYPYPCPILINADSGIEVLNLYPMSENIIGESVLYEHFGIDKSAYEWVVVRVGVEEGTIAAYFIPAPTAPGNNYNSGSYTGHVFSGNMRSPAQVYTVNNIEATRYIAYNLKLLLDGDAIYSTMSTLNIPFTRDETVLLYANYSNEAINANLTNAHMLL